MSRLKNTNKNFAKTRRSVKLKTGAAFAVIAFFAGVILLPAINSSRADNAANSSAAIQTQKLNSIIKDTAGVTSPNDQEIKDFYTADNHFVYAVNPDNPGEAIAYYECGFANVTDIDTFADWCDQANHRGENVTIDLPEYVNIEGQTYPVAVLGKNSFAGILTFHEAKQVNLILPETLTTIDDGAMHVFSINAPLKPFKIPKNVKKFGYHSLTSAKISELYIGEETVFTSGYDISNVTIDKMYVDKLNEGWGDANFLINGATIKDIYFTGDSVNRMLNMKEFVGDTAQYHNMLRLMRPGATLHIDCDVEPLKMTDEQFSEQYQKLLAQYGINDAGEADTLPDDQRAELEAKLTDLMNKYAAEQPLTNFEEFAEQNGHKIAPSREECAARANADADKDGILDEVETDDDNDGVNDADEIAIGLDPTQIDSNGDGVNDGDEDFDGDGIANSQESDANSATITDKNGDTVADLKDKNYPNAENSDNDKENTDKKDEENHENSEKSENSGKTNAGDSGNSHSENSKNSAANSAKKVQLIAPNTGKF